MAESVTAFGRKLAQWFANPVQFVEEALQVKSLTSQQREALEDWGRLLLAKDRQFRKVPLSTAEAEMAGKIGMSIHSGHTTGKDALASWIILHFMVCTLYPKILCTAPTDAQLRSILWSELHKWLRQSLLNDIIVHQAEKLFLKEVGSKEWFAIPRTVTTNSSEEEQAETLAGFNAPYKLIVVDEASGVADAVMRPLEGGLGGRINVVLMIGNCTRPHGFFYASHYGSPREVKEDSAGGFDIGEGTIVKAAVTTHRGEWICKRWNAEESENVNQAHVQRMLRKYGADSNAYRVRVLGLPPTAAPDALVPWDWLLAAESRDLDYTADDPLAIGIDVARYGDDSTVITTCRGMVTTDIREYQHLSGIQVAEWASSVLADQKDAVDVPHGVGVDIIGVGASVYDHLERYGNIQLLYPINVSESPANDVRFDKLRDEILWRVREEFQQGIVKIPNRPELMNECNTIKWAIQPSGKIKIESKKDMKKRGLSSPNFLDSYALARHVRRMLDRPFNTRHHKRHRRGTWATG
jgi:hypothetical protein